MKLNKLDETVITNAKNVGNFTINSNGAVFKIFSDGLYQHKIPAVVREVIWNAADSHKKAGKENTPFVVIYPTSIHRCFEVEDFGVGLDDDEMFDVYTQYFKSTKSESNDEVGGFGLGCKSPFAYTDSFTVRTRKNGIERMYRCYLGNDYAPCISKTYEKLTDLENGVKVSIGVKEQDISTFESEIRWVVSFMKHKPISNFDHKENLYFVKNEDLDLLYSGGGKPKSVSLDLSGWNVPVSQIYTKNARVYVFVGGVIYPLVINKEIKCRNNNEKNFLVFNIGEVEIAPSRESLSLTESTKETVEKRIDFANSVFLENEQERISLFKTNKELVDYYYRHASDWLRKNLKVNDKTLRDYIFSGRKQSRTRELKVGVDPKGKYPYLKSALIKIKRKSHQSLYCKEISPLRLSRLKKLYYNVEVLQWDEFLKAQGIQKKDKVRKVLKKEEKNSFFSTGYSFEEGLFSNREISEIYINSYDHVYHVNHDEKGFWVKYEDYYCYIKSFQRMLDTEKVLILFSNKNNIKKIEGLGIKHVSLLLKKIVDGLTEEDKSLKIDRLISARRRDVVVDFEMNEIAEECLRVLPLKEKDNKTEYLHLDNNVVDKMIEKRLNELGFLDNPIFKNKITLDFVNKLQIKED